MDPITDFGVPLSLPNITCSFLRFSIEILNMLRFLGSDSKKLCLFRQRYKIYRNNHQHITSNNHRYGDLPFRHEISVTTGLNHILAIHNQEKYRYNKYLTKEKSYSMSTIITSSGPRSSNRRYLHGRSSRDHGTNSLKNKVVRIQEPSLILRGYADKIIDLNRHLRSFQTLSSRPSYKRRRALGRSLSQYYSKSNFHSTVSTRNSVEKASENLESSVLELNQSAANVGSIHDAVQSGKFHEIDISNIRNFSVIAHIDRKC